MSGSDPNLFDLMGRYVYNKNMRSCFLRRVLIFTECIMLVCFASINSAQAAEGKIHGRIVTDNNEGLPGCSISIYNNNYNYGMHKDYHTIRQGWLF